MMIARKRCLFLCQTGNSHPAQRSPHNTADDGDDGALRLRLPACQRSRPSQPSHGSLRLPSPCPLSPLAARATSPSVSSAPSPSLLQSQPLGLLPRSFPYVGRFDGSCAIADEHYTSARPRPPTASAPSGCRSEPPMAETSPIGITCPSFPA